MTLYDELVARGLIAQVTDEALIKDLINNGKATFYIGFDPTADSLHVGHFMALCLMKRLQMAGNKPIALIGGGTAMIGDPSGRTDMRKMLTKEDIQNNVNSIKKQIEKFVSFEGDNAAIIVNNADWILDLNYMDFIRTYGVHFNINRMLAAECFKQRMEKGLTFFELNYMLMQSYDFLHLFETKNCQVEIGGDDQWSNMLAGVDLIRKIHKKGSFCLTCPLLLNADGVKMGKTVNGALWLDSKKTSPYEFYQYWRNIRDSEVYDVLRMLTYIPMDEVKRLSSLEGEKINEAKKIAAFEITKLIHGEEEALKAKESAEALFEKDKNSANMPTFDASSLFTNNDNITLIDILVESKTVSSKSQARTLIEQGGISINDEKITDTKYILKKSEFEDNFFILKKGKKTFIKITF